MAGVESQQRLVEHEEHWDLPIRGRSVTRCLIDHAFGLQFWSPETTFDLRIEGPFSLCTPDLGETAITPSQVLSQAPALQLFRKEVCSARAHKGGRLEILFSEGIELRASPSALYEAWEIVGGGQRLVSCPGGGLTVWT